MNHRIIAATLLALSCVPAPVAVAQPDCAATGTRICAPGNTSDRAPGCYADTGALTSLYPCWVVVNPDGTSDVYTVAPAEPVACAHEDGNTDGRPCTWIDPDTGIAYAVTSENYR